VAVWLVTPVAEVADVTPSSAVTMSLEVARSLSVLDLLRLLNEKISLECTMIRESLPAVTAVSLEQQVSERASMYLNGA
jgi:hypothetical protein